MAGLQWVGSKAVVQFTDPNGKRHTLRLGKIAKRTAEQFADDVESLNSFSQNRPTTDGRVTGKR